MLKNYTRQLFAQLSRHLPRRLVQRDPLPDARHLASGPIPESLGQHCLNVAAMDDQEIWRAFDSHPEGLNEGEVAAKILKHGDNQIPAQKPSPWWVHLWTCYRNPFNLLLTVLGIVSYSTEDLFAAGVIALMVGISTLLNFIQEARSTKAADALKAMVSNTATVLRVVNEQGRAAGWSCLSTSWCRATLSGCRRGYDPGGPAYPAGAGFIRRPGLADRRIAAGGESGPQPRSAAAKPAGVRHPVLYGHQRGERLGAGHRLRHRRRTWFGQLAGRVSEQESEPNAFQKGISRVSMLLIRFMLVMAPVVLLINGYTKGDWWEAALFALSVAVGLTPEMLPMIVTSTLARGAVKLSKQRSS